MEIWDVGHSNRQEEDFLSLLKEHKIEKIVDVRRFPTSKKFPYFERSHLALTLNKINISYIWLGDKLGGFRKGGYEQWMKTEDFTAGIEELEKQARHQRTALMCAEAYYGRCHRRFIIKHLEQKGWNVIHL